MLRAMGRCLHALSNRELYSIPIRQSWRVIRVAGMVVIALVLTGRCLLLYTR